MQARIEWLAGNVDAASAELDDALDRLGKSPPSLPQAMHGHAMVYAIIASVEAERGDLDAADRHLASAYEAAKGTTDMPMLAAVAVAGATLAAARGDRAAAAELVAGSTAIRGIADPTNPEITRLDLNVPAPPSRADALARLEAAATSSAAPIGP